MEQLLIDIEFSAPQTQGAESCPVPVKFLTQFSHSVFTRYNLTGSGSKTVDLGSIGDDGNGAKALIVKVSKPPVNPNAAQPITIEVNGSSTGFIEIAPEGMVVFGSSNPTTQGLLGLTLNHTTNIIVELWVYG